MTSKTNSPKNSTAQSFITSAMLCFIFALFFRNSKIAIEYVTDGLLLCANTVIPSLFPFMVLSDVIISAGVADFVGRYLKAPMRRLFGISGSGACAFLLGILCGFPVGAKSAVSLYESGRISKRECERLVPLCSVPSLAFCVNIVGSAVFGSTRAGWLFWLSAVASASIVAILSNLLGSKRDTPTVAPSSAPAPRVKFRPSDLVKAVEDATRSTLIVCGYVIFFSALMGTLAAPLEFFCLPFSARTLICGALELTTGASLCKDIVPQPLSVLLCAFFVGWSGLSVHFQIFSICEGKGLNFKRYLTAKLLQGLLCAAICVIVS